MSSHSWFGDFVAVEDLAWTIYQRCRSSVTGFKDISREVNSLHFALKTVKASLGIRHLSSSERDDLSKLSETCKEVLGDVKKALDEPHMPSGGKGLLKRMQWVSNDLTSLKRRLVSNTSALLTFHSHSTQSFAKVASAEAGILEKLNAIYQEYRDGRRSTPAFCSTTIEDLDADDADTWNKITAELESVGVDAESVSANRVVIRHWIAQVVLGDEDEHDETSSSSSSISEYEGVIFDATQQSLTTSSYKSKKNRRRFLKERNISPSHKRFELLLSENGIHSDDGEYPDNWEGLRRMLDMSRSPPSLHSSEYQSFIRGNAPSRRSHQLTLMNTLTRNDEIYDALDLNLGKLGRLFHGVDSSNVPDLCDGSPAEAIGERIRTDLSERILTSNGLCLPNFFLELTRDTVDKPHAIYNGAIGSQAIHAIRSYISTEEALDNNSYTITSTYVTSTGMLVLYCSHPTWSDTFIGNLEYHTTHLRSYNLKSSLEDFQRGIDALKNAREWAKRIRDRIIAAASDHVAMKEEPLPQGFRKSRGFRGTIPRQVVPILVTEMRRNLSPMDQREGYLYAATHPDIPRLMKIGFSRREPIRRLHQIAKQCKYSPNFVMERRTHYAMRLESLVHKELESNRVVEIKCKGCGSRHQEWFVVSAAEITKVVDRWLGWLITNNPYDHDGKLRPTFHDALYQATRLKTLDAFHDWLATSPGADDASSGESMLSSAASSDQGSTLIGSYKSSSQNGAALEALKDLFANDDNIKPLLSAASKRSILAQGELGIRLSSLLKRFVYDLEAEAEDKNIHEAVQFLRRNARRLGRSITGLFYEPQVDSVKRQLLRDLHKQSKEDGQRQILTNFIEETSPKVLKLDKSIDQPPRSPMEAKEKWLPPDDSEDSASNTSETNAPPSFDQIRNLLIQSQAYWKLSKMLRDYVTSNLFDWAHIQVQWETEMLEPAPFELQAATSKDVQFIQAATPSISDRIKIALETFTDEPWDWWPWEAPTRELIQGKVRAIWRCECGEISSADITPNLASKLAQFLDLVQVERKDVKLPETTMPTSPGDTSPAVRRPVTPPSIGTSSHPISSQNVGATRTGDIPGMRSNTPTLAQQMHPTPSNPPLQSAQDLFILLCVYKGGRLYHDQIRVSAISKDDQFFDDFRTKYRALRGFWRNWLHPRQFSFCHCSRFTRIDTNELSWERNELPPENDPSYSFVLVPPRTPYRPPLNWRYWYKRYHNQICTQSFSNNALQKIPKKRGRFEFSTHKDFEDMWGLNVVFRLSARIVYAWCMLAIAITFWFIPFWLSKHTGDFSTATVPIMVVFTIIVAFYTMLSPTFRTPTFV